MAKKQRFVGRSKDIDALAARIQAYLVDRHFEVAFSKEHTSEIHTLFIQARKRGAMRTATGTRRSTDITIRGTPDDFEVVLGTGEWGNNLISSAPLFVIPVVGIVTTAAKFYTAKKFESDLWKQIKKTIDITQKTSNIAIRNIINEYGCDYIGGYPGWEMQVGGGTMILEKQKNGMNRVVFNAPDGEQITIPASKIEKAAILLQKIDKVKDGLMIELTCKDKSGMTINPVFSMSDEVTTKALIAINDIVAESKQKLDSERLSLH